MTRTIASLLAVAALATTATTASAEGRPAPYSTVSVRIQHSDLDLRTAAGAGAFADRVDAAARQFCRAARFETAPLANRAACEQGVHAEAMQRLPEYARVRDARDSL